MEERVASVAGCRYGTRWCPTRPGSLTVPKIDLVVHGDDYSQENELRLQWDVITFSISWDDAGYAIESSSFIGALSAFVVAGLRLLSHSHILLG